MSRIRPLLSRLAASALALAVIALAAGCTTSRGTGAASSDAGRIRQIVAAAEAAHGLPAYQAQTDLRAHVTIQRGDAVMVDADFHFQCHGDRALMLADGGAKRVVHTGSDCYVLPAAGANPGDRFQVWTWPWFIIAPFKMRGDGIRLSDYRRIEMDGVMYHTMKQTFAAGEGDADEDWYRLFIHPDTHRLDAMVYIVTFGKDAAEVNAAEHVSMIRYYDYREVAGTLIAGRYAFWYWDPVAEALVGDAPKFTGAVSAVAYMPARPDTYAVPAGAVPVPVPAPEAPPAPPQ